MSDVPNHKFPKTVYKYRSWNDVFHRALLYENQVYLSSPKHFNDPFDCQIYPNIYLLDTDEKKQKYAHELVDMNMSTILKLNQHPEEKFFEIMRELIVDLESHQIKTERYLFEIYNQQFGVLSLSGIWNSILMWSHYADYHKGFCVGFNEEALRKSGHFGRGGKVQYKSKFPQFYPGFSYLNNQDETLKRYFVVTHTKALKWSYEKEYRLLKIFNAMNHLKNPFQFSMKRVRII